MVYSVPVAWQYLGESPDERPFWQRLARVLRQGDAWQAVAVRELRQRHAGSVLGLTWVMLHPLLFVAAYVLLFTFIFRARLAPGAAPDRYALYVVVGLLPWVAVTDVAMRATEAMAAHRSLVKYVRFPLEVVPLHSLGASLLSLGIGLLVMLPVLWWRQGSLPGWALMLPLILLAQLAFTIGIAWLLGAVGTFFRDTKDVVQIVVMIGMFLTPIFYLESMLPPLLRSIIWLNPMTQLVMLYRGALLHDAAFTAGPALGFLLASGGALLGGFWVFERARRYLTDRL